MFLNQLNDDEKDMFISLSVHAAETNGDFADEENRMIQEYCKEMGVVFFDSKNIKPMSEVTDYFNSVDISVKRIVYLELIGLLYADGDFDELEQSFAKEFAEKIGLSQKEVDIQTNLLNKYLEITKEMFTAINL